MTFMTKMLAGGLGLAAMAAAAPAAAEHQYGYYPPYSGNYGAPYGNAYGYYGNQNGYYGNSYRNNMTQAAANQCAAAVQARLNNRVGLSGILGAVLGTASTRGQVVTISSVTPSSTRMRVRGLASSGQYAYNNYGYGPYGYGAYGAQGYGYAGTADLSFKCDVDYSGRVRHVDINRRY